MNATLNSSNCNHALNPTAVKIGKIFVFCVILAVSLIGNSLIAIIVFKTKHMRRPINFFIANMAMSDMFYPIFLLPWDITHELFVDTWSMGGNLGQTFCKLLPFLIGISILVSILSVVLIAVDRFGAVVFPLRSPIIKKHQSSYFIVATWIVAMALSSPILIAFKIVEHPETVCELRWDEAFGDSFSVYSLVICIVFVFIPIMLLLALYSIIFLKLQTQTFQGEQSIDFRKRRAKQNRNVLKMAIAIVFGLALCWLPKTVIDVLAIFTLERNSPCEISLYTSRRVAFFLARANCAISPCICFIFSGNFRKGLRELLDLFWCKLRVH